MKTRFFILTAIFVVFMAISAYAADDVTSGSAVSGVTYTGEGIVVTDDGIVFDKNSGKIIDFYNEKGYTDYTLPSEIDGVQVVIVNPLEHSGVLEILRVPETVREFYGSFAFNEISQVYFYTRDCQFVADEPFYAGGRWMRLYAYAVDSNIFDNVKSQEYLTLYALDEDVQTGDINCSGDLDASDAALLLQKVLMSGTFMKSELLSNSDEVIDVNQDGEVNAADCAYILQMVLNPDAVQ